MRGWCAVSELSWTDYSLNARRAVAKGSARARCEAAAAGRCGVSEFRRPIKGLASKILIPATPADILACFMSGDAAEQRGSIAVCVPHRKSRAADAAAADVRESFIPAYMRRSTIKGVVCS